MLRGENLQSRETDVVTLRTNLSHGSLSLVNAAHGLCGATHNRVEFDCERDQKGHWQLSTEQASTYAAAAQACLNLCAHCSGCLWISFSPLHGDCSWFRDCSPGSLQRTTAGFVTGLVAHVKELSSGQVIYARRHHTSTSPSILRHATNALSLIEPLDRVKNLTLEDFRLQVRSQLSSHPHWNTTSCKWQETEVLLLASILPNDVKLHMGWVLTWIRFMECFPKLHIIASNDLGAVEPIFDQVPNVTFHLLRFPFAMDTFYAIQWPMLWADNFTRARHILVLDSDSPLVAPLRCHHLFNEAELPLWHAWQSAAAILESVIKCASMTMIDSHAILRITGGRLRSRGSASLT